MTKARLFEAITVIFAVLAIVLNNNVYSGLAIAFSIWAIHADWQQVRIGRKRERG